MEKSSAQQKKNSFPWWLWETWKHMLLYVQCDREREKKNARRVWDSTWKLNKTRWETLSNNFHHLEEQAAASHASVSSARTFLLNYFYEIFYVPWWGGRWGGWRKLGNDDFMFMALWCLFCASHPTLFMTPLMDTNSRKLFLLCLF